MDSNQGPSACKADALNQLSYAPSYSLSGDHNFKKLRRNYRTFSKNIQVYLQ